MAYARVDAVAKATASAEPAQRRSATRAQRQLNITSVRYTKLGFVTMENVQITCPCCDTVISLCITGLTHSPDRRKSAPCSTSRDTPSTPGKMSMREVFGRDLGSSTQHGSMSRYNGDGQWLHVARDREIRHAHDNIKPYCVCESDRHDEDREYAYPCNRCHALLCANTKCRHSHELYVCGEDARTPQRQLQFNDVYDDRVDDRDHRHHEHNHHNDRHRKSHKSSHKSSRNSNRSARSTYAEPDRRQYSRYL